MSKRIIRVTGSDISSSITEITNRKVNIVLENGQTFFGNIKSFDNSQIVLNDTRDHEHQFNIRDVFEILYDQNSLH